VSVRKKSGVRGGVRCTSTLIGMGCHRRARGWSKLKQINKKPYTRESVLNKHAVARTPTVHGSETTPARGRHCPRENPSQTKGKKPAVSIKQQHRKGKREGPGASTTGRNRSTSTRSWPAAGPVIIENTQTRSEGPAKILFVDNVKQNSVELARATGDEAIPIRTA